MLKTAYERRSSDWSSRRVLFRSGPLRLLDIGCGDGRMMHSLHALARQHWPGRAVEVHGFDIGEHGFKDDGQMAAAIDLLTASHPGVDWKSRIRIIPGDASWG